MSLTNLTKLHLSGNPNEFLTHKSVKKLTNLTELKLWGGVISEEGIKNLKLIHLTADNAISNEGIKNMTDTLFTLILGCNNKTITDEGIKKLTI